MGLILPGARRFLQAPPVSFQFLGAQPQSGTAATVTFGSLNVPGSGMLVGLIMTQNNATGFSGVTHSMGPIPITQRWISGSSSSYSGVIWAYVSPGVYELTAVRTATTRPSVSVVGWWLFTGYARPLFGNSGQSNSYFNTRIAGGSAASATSVPHFGPCSGGPLPGGLFMYSTLHMNTNAGAVPSGSVSRAAAVLGTTYYNFADTVAPGGASVSWTTAAVSTNGSVSVR